MYLDTKFLSIYIKNPKKSLNQLKGVFKPLKLRFYFGTTTRLPLIYCSRPKLITIHSSDVLWKDKYETPRYEGPPYIWIHLFGLNFLWYWTLPLHQEKYIDEYWEQALWYLYYYKEISYGRLLKPDIKKAKESWPWEDYKTKKSSWNDEFLTNLAKSIVK